MYGIRPSDYFWRGRELYKEYRKNGNKSRIIYAALEYRICIERYLFEVLVLLKIKDIPKKYEKLYRAKDLSSTIFKIEPDLIKKLEFTNIFFEALGMEMVN